MNKNEIIRILDDWNFWNKDQESGIDRNYYTDRLHSYLKTDQVAVITGVRRSGKSYIMRQVAKKLINSGVSRNEILVINFEDPRFSQLNASLLQMIYETYLEFLSPKEKPYIFLDEVQEVADWEKWVRTMRELKKAKIIVSGSNAKMLSRDLSTLLTGIHLDLTVYPLSFKEFLFFNDFQVRNDLDIITHQTEIKSLLRKYLEFGSFPEVVLHKSKKEILLSYYDDIINKDLIKRYNVRKNERLRNLAKFYMTNISNLITYNSIEKFINLSADTIEKFSQYFEDVYILFFLSRFSYKVKEQQKSPKKVYCVDTGLANTIGFRLSENLGKSFENVISLELKKKMIMNPDLEVYYWKDFQHREVDFVTKEKNEIKELIQVCWDIEEQKVKKREIKSLVKAMDELKVRHSIVITEDFAGEDNIGGKHIKFIPLWYWCLSI
ncbi:MAG: ATP-binding protein [bacterium]